MVPKLLVLALEFYRAPLRFAHLSDPSVPLPDDFEGWLTETSIALAPGKISETARLLGTSSDEIRTAFRFFLRQTLLIPDADHYRVLGISRHCSAQTVKQHHSLLVRLFHPDRAPQDDERGVALTARINAAYQTLRDPQARRRYDNLLPPCSGSSITDVREFCQPRDQGIPLSSGVRIVTGRPGSMRTVWLWTLASFIVILLLLHAVRESSQPALRMNPELAVGSAPGPSFLYGEQSANIHAEQPRISNALDAGQSVDIGQPVMAEAEQEKAEYVASRMRESGKPEATRERSDGKASTAAVLTPILMLPDPPQARRPCLSCGALHGSVVNTDGVEK